MKLQAIKRLCVARKTIEIRNTPEGLQWIGNGEAFYPVDDDIHIRAGNVAGLFDLDDKAMDKIKVNEIEEDDTRFSIENAPEEKERITTHFAFHMGDQTYRLLCVRSETAFLNVDTMMVNVAYLKPAENKEGYMEFRLRQAHTAMGTRLRPLVAVYGNLLCAALVYPESKTWTEEVIKQMRDSMVFRPLDGLEGKTYAEREEADAEAYERECEEATRRDAEQIGFDDHHEAEEPDDEA